jgi:hypothetical protein
MEVMQMLKFLPSFGKFRTLKNRKLRILKAKNDFDSFAGITRSHPTIRLIVNKISRYLPIEKLCLNNVRIFFSKLAIFNSSAPFIHSNQMYSVH